MEFTIRKLNSTDYEEILTEWWNDWRWTPPLKDFLPENGEGGIIVYDGDIPVCAGFYYVTNSKVGWCDWIISNFQYKNKQKRKKALSQLVNILSETLKVNGCKYSYALLKSKSLISIYENNGYTQGDSYNTEMIKLL